MKYRSGFVSNSSSSSFICDVCGCEESGWDMLLSDAEMYECENGHTFCERHASKPSEEDMISLLQEWSEDISEEKLNGMSIEEFFDYIKDDHLWRTDMPEKYCPCCNFDSPAKDDLVKYLLYRSNMTMDEIKTEFENSFGTVSEMKKALKK